jgi:F-box-like
MDLPNDNHKMTLESEIRSKLAVCEERIAQLEQQLLLEREQRDSLLAQLQPQRNPYTDTSFPNEIILKIFEAVVAVDSPTMRRILLVSRKWNQMAMNQPSLWARLSFQVPETMAINYLMESTSYTKQALLRSGDLLLDISIDFRAAGDLDTIALSEAGFGFQVPKHLLTDWWYSWRYHTSPNRKDSCVFVEITRGIFFNFMRSLSHQASHRWRTFTFKSTSGLSHRSSDNRSDFSPILFYVSMQALERVDLLDYTARYMAYIPETKHLLIHSKLLGQERNRDAHNKTLRILHLRVDSTFTKLHGGSNLVTLSIDITEDLDPEKVAPISLRTLETLSIRGPSAHAILSHLNTPRLHTLRLIGKGAIESSQLIRDLGITHLHILAVDADSSSVRAFIAATITEAANSRCIYIMPWHLELAIEEIRQLGSGTYTGPMVKTVEWNVKDANSEGLEENLWRLEEKTLQYKTQLVS